MASPLIEAAVDREGRPLPFHSREQLLLLQIFKSCTLIPVIGCNLEALNRIRLLSFSSYRLTSHGALIWHANNILISDWKKRIEQEAVIWERQMQRLLAAIEGCCRAECLEDLRFHIIYDAEIPVYLSIKGNPKQILAMKEAISPLWVQKWGG
jgi:hypothetical protein